MVDDPNVVFVLTDQLRPEAVTPETAPNVHALADDGVSFANCYCASPLCMPSRNCLVTGQFPSQHGVCGNMNEPLDAEQRGDTYLSHLREEGYHTALVGKHHLIDRYNVGMDVCTDREEIESYGFDSVHTVVDEGENVHNEDRYTRYMAEQGRLEEYRRIQEERAWEGGEFPYEASEFVDAYVGRQAVAFVDEYDRADPFFLNASFIGPHPPYWVPDEFDTFDPAAMPAPRGVEDPERVRELKEVRAKYRGRVALIDHWVGELTDALERRGIREETLVVFTSDHGDCLGDHGVVDKRRFFEQSATVPLVMSGPGIEVDDRLGGVTRKELVSGVDLYPTFLDAADADDPTGEADRDGRSLFPLANNGETERRDAVFSELGTASMVRTANWKLVFDPEQGGVQGLYDLRADPDELDNLAGDPAHESVREELLSRLLGRLVRQRPFTHEKEQQRVQRVRQ
ncbi:MAG: sulfatase [Halobacteriaceae archaeon]